MLIKTHVVFGLFSYFISLQFLNLNFNMKIIFLLFLMLGVFFVDIDHKKSKAGNHFYFRPFQWFFKHRGFVHSFLSAILISLVIFFFTKIGAYGFFLGYVSHLILDSLTKGGIILFWPLRKRFSFGLKTGGILEDVIFVLLLFIDLYFVFIMLF